MSYLFHQPSLTQRTGKHNRVNTDRFFHIMNEGWFVYMRKEPVLLENIPVDNGVAGPFQTKPIARAFLTNIAQINPVAEEQPIEKSNNNNSEDWRY